MWSVSLHSHRYIILKQIIFLLELILAPPCSSPFIGVAHFIKLCSPLCLLSVALCRVKIIICRTMKLHTIMKVGTKTSSVCFHPCVFPLSVGCTVCDPVMGDEGKFYVTPELLPVYRDKVSSPTSC